MSIYILSQQLMLAFFCYASGWINAIEEVVLVHLTGTLAEDKAVFKAAFLYATGQFTSIWSKYFLF